MGPNVQNVLAGIDPVSGDEFRAFLHFPLDTVARQARTSTPRSWKSSLTTFSRPMR